MTAGAGRLPDFLILGAFKAGTTSLFSWLGAQPGVWVPAAKEPSFFALDKEWDRGVDAYRNVFAPAPAGTLVGEASVRYGHPDFHRVAAGRIRSVVPDVRLFFLARHPVERIRSDYRHQVQRGRERRGLVDALRDPANRYLRASHYHFCLEPYLELFPAEQLRVLVTEELVTPPWSAWDAALDHLGLPRRPPPQEVHNATADKAAFRPAATVLWERGWLTKGRSLPAPVRRLGRRVLLRDTAPTGPDPSTADIPADLLAPVWDDVRRLEGLLGRSLWAEGPEVVPGGEGKP